MTLLTPQEYDINYFDGNLSGGEHPAGYSSYNKWYRNDGVNSTGELWKDIATKFLNSQAAQNKKVLELGCAKGFIVEYLRSFGVDAYGIDISSYAISQADPAIQAYLTVGDVRTVLTTYKNKEFDIVFGMGILTCLSDSEQVALCNAANRIGKKVIFIETQLGNPNYYNFKTPSQWETLIPIGVTVVDKEQWLL